MAADDRHEFFVDQLDRLLEKLGVLGVVGVQTVYEFLPGVDTQVTRDGNPGDAVVGRMIQLKRTLVAQLILNPALNIVHRTVGVHIVVEKNLAQGLEGLVGEFLESAVAVARRILGKIGRSGLEHFADAGGLHCRVVRTGALTTEDLAAHRLRLVHEKNDDMEHRLAELRSERSSRIAVAEFIQFLVEQAKAKHLHFRSGIAIHHHSGLVFRIKQGSKKQTRYLAVADHHSRIDQFPRRRAFQKVADDDRLGRVAAVGLDESGLCALSRAGSAVEPDDFIWETQPLDADLLLQLVPSSSENEVRILHLQIDGGFLGSGGRGRRFLRFSDDGVWHGLNRVPGSEFHGAIESAPHDGTNTIRLVVFG